MIVGEREQIEAACNEVAQTCRVGTEVKRPALPLGVAAQIVAVGNDRFHVEEVEIAVDVLGDELGRIGPGLEAEFAHAARLDPLTVAIEADIADEDDGHFVALPRCRDAGRVDANQRKGQDGEGGNEGEAGNEGEGSQGVHHGGIWSPNFGAGAAANAAIPLRTLGRQVNHGLGPVSKMLCAKPFPCKLCCNSATQPRKESQWPSTT